MIVRGGAIGERPEPPQQLQLLVAKPGDMGDRLRTCEHAKQAQQKHLTERINHLAELARIRQTDVMTGARGALDATATVDELRALDDVLPREWLAASATGSPEQYAARVLDQYAAGADAVILHGASPTELSPITRNLQGFPREAWKTVQISGVETR